MPSTCPLCGQPLPRSIDERALHRKLERMNSKAVEAEKDELRKQFSARLTEEREVECDRARRKLEQVRRELEEAAAKKSVSAVEKARKEGAEIARSEMRRADQQRTGEFEKKIDVLQREREKDRRQHALEIVRFQGKVDELSRKLEKQSTEQAREEGEFELYTELLRAFGADEITRIGHGIKGGDILHRVLDSGKEAGRIVYEVKNVGNWNKAFVAQAKKYHTQYDTPYVMIVSRALPRKQRGLCVVNRLPVIEPSGAVALASVIREGIIEVAKLRLTRTGTNEKAQELFGYVIGDEFRTRFSAIYEAANELKSLQQTEPNWHERHWANESEMHSRIQKRHSEIEARIQSITRGSAERKLVAVAAGDRRAVGTIG